MRPPRSPALTWSLAVLAVCLVYAAVRYHVFGGVAWPHLPLFVFNKAVSLAGVILLAAAYFVRERELAKSLGLSGFALGALHSLQSLALLGPGNYPKLFEDGRLNLWGEISVLCGCLPLLVWTLLAVFSIPAAGASLPPERARRLFGLGYWALALTAVHVAAIGWQGWFAPSTWHGGLPPITLLSFVAAAAPLVWRAARPNRNATPPSARSR